MNLWKSGFLKCAKMYVMQKKLSPKERKEPVTKGFLEDYENYLKNKHYVTETRLEEILDSKNYVTKDYLFEAFDIFEQKMDIKMDEKFEKYQKEYFAHLQSMMEDYHGRMYNLIELFNARFERIERFVGLA
jgi:hypothetical protein